MFLLPGLPDTVVFKKPQIHPLLTINAGLFITCRDKVWDAEEAYGVIVNSFEESEADYVEKYKRVTISRKVWCIGPVLLSNKDDLDKDQKGKPNSSKEEEEEEGEEGQYLKCLDSWPERSIIYVCLGSLFKVPLKHRRSGTGYHSFGCSKIHTRERKWK